jgi:DNA polymerase-3 subunit delta'
LQNIFSSQLAANQPLATQLLSAAWQRRRLLPAYLLVGRGRAVKWELVKQLASQLNCVKRAQSALSSCRVDLASEPDSWCVNCRWIDRDEHPQALRVLAGEGKSGKVAAEKARELTDELAKSSNYYRVVVVEDASQEMFHRPAANALLKTIEEPHPGILLIFFALNQEDVLPTVVSRCQTLFIVGASLAEEGIWSLSNPANRVDASQSAQFEEIRQLLKETRDSHRKKRLVKSIALSEKLHELLEDEELNFDELIDFLAASEINGLGKEVTSSPDLVRYARELLHLSETAKIHNRQFVSRKPILETLTFSWNKLRTELKCQ